MKIILDERVGIFSDTHLGLGQDSRAWQDAQIQFASWAADKYRMLGINQILIAGDLFHNRNEINLTTLQAADKFLSEFKDFDIFISTGNHDCFYKNNSNIHSLSILRGRSNIRIIDEAPEVFKTVNGKTVSMIPWGTPVENIPDADICVGHFDINTFPINAAKTCDHGIESHNLLKKSSLVISGHFHKRSSRTYKNGSINYIGSPYQQNFGDEGNIHGISVLKMFSNPVLEFIPNNNSPVHHKISLSRLIAKEYPSLMQIIPRNMICLLIDTEIRSDKLALLMGKLQEMKPSFFRVDYQVSNNFNTIEGAAHEYTTIDIPGSIQDFVSVLETPYKLETSQYLLDLYQNLTV